MRLVIDDNIDPANWTYSKVFNDGEVGPVTTSVANLFDRKTGKLWLYFAEGRYSYKTDDLPTTRKLFGVQEPCYNSTTNSITSVCTPLGLTNLKDQTSSPTSTLTATEKGWYINMDAATTGMAAERVISNPTPDSLGAIYFLSFAPTSDICGYGGTTYLWGLDYQSGGHVTYEMQGKALIQVSTGEIKELKLSDAFTENDNRKSVGFKGIPPAGQGIMIASNPHLLKNTCMCRNNNMKLQDGFTLIELLIVVSITGIILAMVTLSFSRMNQKYNVESDIKEIYSILMRARNDASKTNTQRVVSLTANQVQNNRYRFTINCGTSPVAPCVAADAITFDRRGLADKDQTISITGYSADTNPTMDCIEVAATRINIGIMNGVNCVQR